MYRLKSIKYIAATGVLTALIFTLGYCSTLITFFINGNKSIFQISDAFLFIASLIFAGPMCYIAGSIGASLIDIANQAFIYIPATIVIHILMVLIIQLIFKFKNNKYTYLFSFFIASCLTFLYVLYNYLVYNSYSILIIEVIVDSIQFAVTYLLSISLCTSIININKDKLLWNDDEFKVYKKGYNEKK